MLILLPPSEGKSAPTRGKPLDLAALAYPELTPQREEVLERVDPALREAPTAAAAQVYSGVLYGRLRLTELPKRSWRKVLIASALWGVVRPGDRIPHYKLPIATKVPGLPALAGWWRPHLEAALPDRRGLVVDMRSGGYAAAWRPRTATLLPVRALTAEGKVISHMAKAVRGDVARVLLESGEDPRTPEAALEIVRAAGLRADLRDGSLDVIG